MDGKVLFNDTLYTFHLRLYGVGHMVEDHSDSERKEGNALYNNALNTFHLRLYGIGHIVEDQSDSEREWTEMFYLTTFVHGVLCVEETT